MRGLPLAVVAACFLALLLVTLEPSALAQPVQRLGMILIYFSVMGLIVIVIDGWEPATSEELDE